MCEYWGKICPACGDRMIHQTKRGPDESSSAFGQFLHDRLPRQFNVVDDDADLYLGLYGLNAHARSTGILRKLEHKFSDQDLSRSQKEMLPLYAAMFYYGCAYRVLQPGSGVWIVTADEPFDSAMIQRVLWSPPSSTSWDEPIRLEGSDWHNFCMARPIELAMAHVPALKSGSTA